MEVNEIISLNKIRKTQEVRFKSKKRDKTQGNEFKHLRKKMHQNTTPCDYH